MNALPFLRATVRCTRCNKDLRFRNEVAERLCDACVVVIRRMERR